MRKALIAVAVLVAVAVAAFLLWRQPEFPLTPPSMKKDGVTVLVERFDVWTDEPPSPESPPPLWLQNLLNRLPGRRRDWHYGTPWPLEPSPAGTRYARVRLRVSGLGIGPNPNVALKLVTEQPPDRTPEKAGYDTRGGGEVVVNALFLVTGDGAILGLDLTLDKELFRFTVQ